MASGRASRLRAVDGVPPNGAQRLDYERRSDGEFRRGRLRRLFAACARLLGRLGEVALWERAGGLSLLVAVYAHVFGAVCGDLPRSTNRQLP